jgi:hypothetical protein
MGSDDTGTAGGEAPGPTLSARDLSMLAFERAWWRRGGMK